jgi:hypothetical protein
MLRDVLILISCGTAVYAWLCAAAAPLVRSVRALVLEGTREAWIGLVVSMASAALWTGVALAAILLAVIFAPHAGLLIAQSDLLQPAVEIGAAAWSVQAIVQRSAPGFGAAFEVASAEAFAGSSSVKTAPPVVRFEAKTSPPWR